MYQNNKMLKITKEEGKISDENYGLVLAILALAEATMVKHNGSALNHFIAIVKELEKQYGFSFKEM